MPWRCVVSHFRRQHRDPILPSRPLAVTCVLRRLAQRQDVRARYVEARAMLAVLLKYGNLASALDRYRIARLEPQKLGLGGFIEGDDVRPTAAITVQRALRGRPVLVSDGGHGA